MNKDEFIEKLSVVDEALGGKWELDEAWQMRLEVDHPKLGNLCFCPITAVCYAETGCYWSVARVPLAAKKLHIDPALGLEIVFAADTSAPENVDYHTLQEEMLTAVGLSLDDEND